MAGVRRGGLQQKDISRSGSWSDGVGGEIGSMLVDGRGVGLGTGVVVVVVVVVGRGRRRWRIICGVG